MNKELVTSLRRAYGANTDAATFLASGRAPLAHAVLGLGPIRVQWRPAGGWALDGRPVDWRQIIAEWGKAQHRCIALHNAIDS